MSANRENLMNPGLFIRITDDERFEIVWMDGFQVIELAYKEEEESDAVPITQFLKVAGHHDFDQEIYDEWGVRQSVVSLRNLTLREAGTYLGRHAKVCVFLRPKEQAVRFMRLLEEGTKFEKKVAKEISKKLELFDIAARKLFAERVAAMIELDRSHGLL